MADDLAVKMRQAIREVRGLRVTRPLKRAKLWLQGMDDSITKEELAESVAGVAASRTWLWGRLNPLRIGLGRCGSGVPWRSRINSWKRGGGASGGPSRSRPARCAAFGAWRPATLPPNMKEWIVATAAIGAAIALTSPGAARPGGRNVRSARTLASRMGMLWGRPHVSPVDVSRCVGSSNSNNGHRSRRGSSSSSAKRGTAPLSSPPEGLEFRPLKQQQHLRRLAGAQGGACERQNPPNPPLQQSPRRRSGSLARQRVLDSPPPTRKRA